ncbi:hypothetical protein G3I32_39865 [Streptomyces coelicoflavus]|uniref:Uncharacterized protein n=1 Tax=Streptomyces coelicoflavus TaxID=285562 RepID=A0A7K3PY84_9ACTN|nr:hypothetical protein [Streptomyces coelicoflavus]NEB14910.1 hypothetical protein [Streptomyces coelicoflavus]
MDYCSSCRRHLNGALVCPGCGAYAPDIAPHVTVGDRVTAPGPALVRTDSAADDADSGTGSDTAPHAPAADVGDLPPARQQGRAARRRQLTRWKKNKRRAVVASAVALVGGGLSLATMDRQSGDRAQATAAPDHRSMGAADEEITERDRPVPARTTPEDTHRPSRTPARSYEQRHEQRHGQSRSQSSVAGAPRQQSVAEVPRTAPATPPRTTASSPPPATPTPPQSPSSATSTADTSTVDTSTTDAGSSDSRSIDAGSGRSDPAADGRASETSPTPPALISTSPTEVCLLGLCLG